MSMNELKLHSCKEGLLAAERGQWPARGPHGRFSMLRWLPAALIVIAVITLQALPARAQSTTPTPTPAANPCPTPLTPGQTLMTVPELIARDKKLRGTLVLSDEQEWMAFRIPVTAPSDSSRSLCFPQHVRTFRGVDTFQYVRNSQGIVEAVPYSPNTMSGAYHVPMPGPTLRARVGDLIQLTFINQINPANFPYSIDQGEKAKTGRGGGCDESNAGYPGGDKYPDCFHGSSTGNIHFHGTHTNPNSTGDNVFIEIRPLPRDNAGKLTVTPEKVQESLDKFFARCDVTLGNNFLVQWPNTWKDLPKDWTDQQEDLLKSYDREMGKKYGTPTTLWKTDAKQVDEGAWPQYYIGAYPYCFRLPEYTLQTWPPPATPPTMHTGMKTEPDEGGAGTAELSQTADGTMDVSKTTRALLMGQSPGLHWYHAHKHGSTAINVANGMTGAFIIEGQYDDDLNAWYGAGWTRTQPVLVINQLGVSPNLLRGPNTQIDKGPDFSINGQLKPMIQMRPGEVQMWRIVNTSGRAGALFTGPPAGFEWKQLAQDGVQFNEVNYRDNHNKPFLLAAGNRADLLVKAPAAPCTNPAGCTYPVIVKNEVDPADLVGPKAAQPLTLMSVSVSGTPVDPTSNGAKFIQKAPTFPPFLADITDDKVKGTKVIRFASTPPVNPPSVPGMHTIDGKKFDGEVGAVVLLNTVEEWKVINETYGPAISHPFHIHINPFQVVEVFDPNEILTDRNGKPVIDRISKQPVNKYVFQGGIRLLPGQCFLNPNGNPDDWKPCTPSQKKNLIWWDVFPIPSGRVVTLPNKKTVNVPGYFKMRSRFVDYSGYYVIHCHILAHEDRGMMTIVEVSPARTPYSHN